MSFLFSSLTLTEYVHFFGFQIESNEPNHSLTLFLSSLLLMHTLSHYRDISALFLLERAALTEKSHGKEYYMVEDEKISDENSGDGVGVGGVRSKLKRIMSFSKRPPMFGY